MVASIVRVFHLLVPVLAALAMVLFMLGVLKYIRHSGKAHDRTNMLWSLVVLFVLFSVWGILRLVCATLIGNASCSSSGLIETTCNTPDCGAGYYYPGKDATTPY